MGVVGVSLALRIFYDSKPLPAAAPAIRFAPLDDPAPPAPSPRRATWVEHGDLSVYEFSGEQIGSWVYPLALDDDSVWVGTTGGLIEYEARTDRWTLHPLPFSPGLFGVGSLIAGGDGRLAAEVYEHRANNRVRKRDVFWFDPRTDTWTPISGATGAHLHHWDGTNLWAWLESGLHTIGQNSETSRTYSLIDNPAWRTGRIRRLDSRDGELWSAAIGSHAPDVEEWTGGGVSRLSPETDRWVHYSTEDGLADNYCSAVSIGRDDVWVAHWHEERGLSRFDRKTGRWQNFERSANGLEIGGVEVALDGSSLWIAQQGGLVHLDTRTLMARRWKEPDGLPGYIVSDLMIGPKHVWASAFSYGGDGRRHDRAGIVRIPREYAPSDG